MLTGETARTGPALPPSAQSGGARRGRAVCGTRRDPQRRGEEGRNCALIKCSLLHRLYLMSIDLFDVAL